MPVEERTGEVKVSAEFEHCVRLYHKLRSTGRRITRPIEGVTGGTEEVFLWEGHLTKAVKELGLAVPYYTSITAALKGMGCMQLLRRGGGSALSQWQLFDAPTVERYKTYKAGMRMAIDVPDQRDVQIRELAARIDRLEDALNIPHFLDPLAE